MTGKAYRSAGLDIATGGLSDTLSKIVVVKGRRDFGNPSPR